MPSLISIHTYQGKNSANGSVIIYKIISFHHKTIQLLFGLYDDLSTICTRPTALNRLNKSLVMFKQIPEYAIGRKIEIINSI